MPTRRKADIFLMFAAYVVWTGSAANGLCPMVKTVLTDLLAVRLSKSVGGQFFDKAVETGQVSHKDPSPWYQEATQMLDDDINAIQKVDGFKGFEVATPERDTLLQIAFNLAGIIRQSKLLKPTERMSIADVYIQPVVDIDKKEFEALRTRMVAVERNVVFIVEALAHTVKYGPKDADVVIRDKAKALLDKEGAALPWKDREALLDEVLNQIRGIKPPPADVVGCSVDHTSFSARLNKALPAFMRNGLKSVGR